MKTIQIWQKGKTFGIISYGGLYYDRIIRTHIFYAKGRTVVELSSPDSQVTVCGKWKLVGSAKMEWPDHDWQYVKMSPETHKRFMREFLGVDPK